MTVSPHDGHFVCSNMFSNGMINETNPELIVSIFNCGMWN